MQTYSPTLSSEAVSGVAEAAIELVWLLLRLRLTLIPLSTSVVGVYTCLCLPASLARGFQEGLPPWSIMVKRGVSTSRPLMIRTPALTHS